VSVSVTRWIKKAILRQREYLADASAVQFTRDVDGLGGVLKKIGGLPNGSRIQSIRAEEVSHMFFSNPLGSWIRNTSGMHPPLSERIRRIDPAWDGTFSSPVGIEDSPEYLIGRFEKICIAIQRVFQSHPKAITATLCICVISLLVWWGNGIMERRNTYQSLVSEMESAWEREDWHVVYAATDKILQLDSDHETAREMRYGAVRNLKSNLSLRVSLQGKEIPATVRLPGFTTYTLPKVHTLDVENYSYQVLVSYNQDGQWYQAPPMVLVSDWEWVREIELDLEPYSGPVPVPGEN